MSKAVIFFAPGFEECEGLLTVDILRRGGCKVTTVSITDSLFVESSHGVEVKCDAVAGEADLFGADAVILPGGIPGTYNLLENKNVVSEVRSFAEQGKTVAAICAAPYILAQLGLLEGKRATAHKNFRDKLKGAIVEDREVVTDGSIITAWGLGAAIPFALTLCERLEGRDAAERVRQAIDYRH